MSFSGVFLARQNRIFESGTFLAIRYLFRVKTPLGYVVTMSRDRWRQITRYKHRAVAGKEKAVRACLQSPSIIRASAKDPTTLPRGNFPSARSSHRLTVMNASS